MKYVNYTFKPWKTAVIRLRINGPTTIYRKNNLNLGNTGLKQFLSLIRKIQSKGYSLVLAIQK